MSITSRTFWLSMHVRYACRDTGACCTSGWPIPLETARASAVRRAIEVGRIGAPLHWLVESPEQPDKMAGVIALSAEKHCVFHRGHRCAIHSTLGPGALPSACQHFPRIVLIDPRGAFVTLSHYCPTAADLLFDTGDPLAIVAGPPPLAEGSPPEGLDARQGWPPLLTSRTLMDHESYGVWEQHMIATLAAHAPENALARLGDDVAALERWRPEDRPLVDAVRALTCGGPTLPPSHEASADRGQDRPHTPPVAEAEASALRMRLFNLVRHAVPGPLTWPDAPADFDGIWRERVTSAWPAFATVVGRYLAARAFGSWVAYQGHGLAAVVRSLGATLAVLEVETARACIASGCSLDRDLLREAVRRTDLLVVHYADRQSLADLLSW